MAHAAMATFCTPENNRFPLLLRTLDSLARTVDWSRHRLVVIDNASTCPEARAFFDFDRESDILPRGWTHKNWLHHIPHATLIRNAENRGTAKAVNQGWLLGAADSPKLKMDDDVEIHDRNWLDRLEECVARDPQLGIVGLKRKDLAETPHAPPGTWSHSTLEMLPHEPGQRWLVVERVQHVMGTCQLYSPRLLERIGFLYQMGLRYSLDDALAALRCKAAGFYSAFYSNVDICHIDPGTSPYQPWKERIAREGFPRYDAHIQGYAAGVLDVFNGPDDDDPKLTPLGVELLDAGKLSPAFVELVRPRRA